MKVVRGSVWWDLAEMGSSNVPRFSDSCHFIRCVLKGIILSLATVFCGVVIAFMPLDFILWLVVGLANDSFPAMGISAGIFCAMAIGGSIIGSFNWIVAKLKAASNRNVRNTKPPSFVAQAYRSWKDKFCTRVEIVEK